MLMFFRRYVMKKLLILMLVLGLTAVVNGIVVNITLSSSDNYTNVTPGTVITVDFSIDQTIRIIANTTGIDFTATGATNEMALGSWQNSPSATGTSNGTLATDKLSITGASANWLTDQTAGTILYSYELTINVPGCVGMANLDGADFMIPPPPPGQFFAIGTVTSFCFTPEPMTIVLLGLGGLFLRRRR
jgi:hypothetical protein